MKFFLCLFLIYSLPAQAITFTYNYQGDSLTLELPNKSWEEGFKVATNKCMDYYSKGQGAAVGEEKWLDLIDVCVNPKSKKD